MSSPWKASIVWTDHSHDLAIYEYFEREDDAWRWIDSVPPHAGQTTSVIWDTTNHPRSKPPGRTELAPPDPAKLAKVKALRAVLEDLTKHTGKGADGHSHGGPDKCPVCGGIAPHPDAKR